MLSPKEQEDCRMLNAVRKFPEDTTLRNELEQAMARVRARGVRHPKGHLERLLKKYTRIGIEYPRILMRLGEPLILKHGHYKRVLKKGGRFLDFGCGTGDDVRQLIIDGYPRSDLVGFDIDTKCLDLGYDFYLDRSRMKSIFIVSKAPRFNNGSFDVVYSGSVLHTMHKMAQVNLYLSKTWDFLRPGGVFFGSTLGSLRSKGQRKKTTFLTKKRFYSLLRKKGFKDIDIIGTKEKAHSVGKTRYWFYCVKE